MPIVTPPAAHRVYSRLEPLTVGDEDAGYPLFRRAHTPRRADVGFGRPSGAAWDRGPVRGFLDSLPASQPRVDTTLASPTRAEPSCRLTTWIATRGALARRAWPVRSPRSSAGAARPESGGQFATLVTSNGLGASVSFVTTVVLARSSGSPNSESSSSHKRPPPSSLFLLTPASRTPSSATSRSWPSGRAEAPQRAFSGGFCSSTEPSPWQGGLLTLAFAAFGGFGENRALDTALLVLAACQNVALAPYGTIGAAYGVSGGWGRLG